MLVNNKNRDFCLILCGFEVQCLNVECSKFKVQGPSPPPGPLPRRGNMLRSIVDLCQSQAPPFPKGRWFARRSKAEGLKLAENSLQSAVAVGSTIQGSMFKVPSPPPGPLPRRGNMLRSIVELCESQAPPSWTSTLLNTRGRWLRLGEDGGIDDTG